MRRTGTIADCLISPRCAPFLSCTGGLLPYVTQRSRLISRGWDGSALSVPVQDRVRSCWQVGERSRRPPALEPGFRAEERLYDPRRKGRPEGRSTAKG